MYKAVFLDAGNTLFHTPVPRQKRIGQVLARRGRQITPEAIETAMDQVRNEMWDSPLWPPKTARQEKRWWLEYYTCLLDYLGEDIDLAGDLAEEVLYVHHAQAFNDVKEVLETLQGQVKLGVISNAFPMLNQTLDKLDLASHFDQIINSSLVDSWKPDERIFRIALKRLDVAPETSVFVDDLEENIAAAEDLGFTAILIDRWEQRVNTPYQRISDLRPVVKLVMDSAHS